MPPGNTDIAVRLALDVERFILSRRLIPEGSRVLAAVSGGADSTALRSRLRGLSRRLSFTLCAGHFDHGLRESSRSELERAARFAASLGVPCRTGSGDVRALAASTGDSLEEAARKARYGFLESAAADAGADIIATGHTRSDHIETVLMRVIRGTGLRGAAGIPARRGKIVRPLLSLSREDTVSYCEASRLAYIEDASNADLRFFRNRVRHELLPLLESRYDAGIRDHLAGLAAGAAAVIEAMRKETRPVADRHLVEPSPGRWILDADAVERLDDAAVVVLFGDIFAEKLSCDMDFTRAHYEGLVRLVRDPRATGKSLSLPGLTVAREHGRIVIARGTVYPRGPEPRLRETLLRVPGETTGPGFVATTEILERSALGSGDLAATDRHAVFDLGSLALPLCVRAPRAGDRMQPFGMPGTKKLSDVFIDRKIPLGERASFLVLTDARDVVWLVGVATSEKCRVGSATRDVLKVRIERK